jgi:hypothetical protein
LSSHSTGAEGGKSPGGAPAASPAFAASIRAQEPAAGLQRARLLLEAGFEKLVLEEPLHARTWEALEDLLPRERLIALRLFVPYPRDLHLGAPSPFRLGSLDAAERRDALKQGEASLLLAERQAIPFVLLPVVRLEGPPGRSAAKAAERQELGRLTLDSYRSTLDRLLAAAERLGRTICVTPSAREDELTSPDAACGCLREFSGAPLALWLDTCRWAPEPPPAGERPGAKPLSYAGASLHDLEDGREGLVPGTGTLDWAALGEPLRAAPVWVLDLRAGAAPDEIIEGRKFLEELHSPPEAGGGTRFW